MKIAFYNFGIYNVDVAYLKYLYGVDSEVYYSENRYDKKPFLGITVGIGFYTYFIPFSSPKQKHLKWDNVGSAHYLIYEYADRNRLPGKAICRTSNKPQVMHILAVLDIKKMIPVPDGLYLQIDINKIADRGYRALLKKEDRFCQKVQLGILERVTKIYKEQKKTGKIHKFYCNFAALEAACDSYGH